MDGSEFRRGKVFAFTSFVHFSHGSEPCLSLIARADAANHAGHASTSRTCSSDQFPRNTPALAEGVLADSDSTIAVPAPRQRGA